MDYAHSLMSSVTQSGRGYQGMGGVGNSPLIYISRESEEDLARFLPRSAVQLITECIPLIPPPSMPSLPSPTSCPSTPPQPSPPPPPPPRIGMVAAVKLLTFQGIGNEDPS